MSWHAWEAFGHGIALLSCLGVGAGVIMDMRSHHSRLIGATPADIRRNAWWLVAAGGMSMAGTSLAVVAAYMRAVG